jgi:hypothetical protein
MDGQSISRRTPEEIRAERIATIADPKARQDLDAIAKARDAKLAQERDKQGRNFEKRVSELRDQKIRSANAPQLMPRGMRSPYLGKDGHERATLDAKAQIQTLDHSHLRNVAKEYNDRIDKRLDAPREIQLAREPARLQPGAEPQRGPVAPMRPARGPNRYAQLIENQNYAERAKQPEPNREKEMDPARQQQRQRGLQR